MISKRNLQDVMFIRSLPVRNAGQDFIAAVDAMRITYVFNGDIHKAYELSCKIQRKRIQCAILMKVLEQLEA